MKLNEALDRIAELIVKVGLNMDEDDDRPLDEWWTELVEMIDEEISEEE